MSTPPAKIDDELKLVEDAGDAGKLTPSAVEHIKAWLTEPRYADYVPQVIAHIRDGQWQQLDDVFWTIIPFGTGGRRGRMYPIGSNAINDRTIGESAQGLATYVKETLGESDSFSCAIAYDTRHRSREFAELCASIMVANGFQVFFLDGYRSTPELSFTVREKKCSCGIMITASHNPPSDNAVKVYWSTGGQLLPPHDTGVIQKVMEVDQVLRVPFQEALEQGKVVYCQEEMDSAFITNLKAQALAGPRDIKILYTPLHGVGGSAVLPALQADGFPSVEVYQPHAEPNGDFPNVPKNVANPENPAVFEAPIAYAQKEGFELILATDPDCDRLGCASPVGSDPAGEWTTFTGNQIGVLLAEYILSARKAAGSLSPEHYVIETLVTTQMTRRIADDYGVKTFGDLLVGFKHIAGTMDEQGPDKFVFGTEESHGYLVGQYCRDKDGAVAAMLLSELAAKCKQEGKSLAEKLDSLYWQYGYHAEHTLSVTMPGSEGMSRMKEVMSRMRSEPPSSLGGIAVKQSRDYLQQTRTPTGGSPEPLSGPKGDLVILDLEEEGNYVAVRPSGTEPKIKFYQFVYVPAEELASLERTKKEMGQRLSAFEKDLRAFAGV